MNNKINFAWPVTSENAVVYQRFQSEVERLKDTLAAKRIVIFGAGIRGCCLLRILEQRGFTDIVFCDNNAEKQGHLINDYDIISLGEALGYESGQVFLIAPENSGAISQQLTEAGLTEGKDWFSFDISVYDAYVSEYRRSVSEHLLVVGDCAFSHIALKDEVTDSLGEMMKARLREHRCKVLSMHGIGQQANYHIIRSLLDQKERPSSVFLLVMEALTPKAHLMPRTQHPTLIQSLVDTVPNPRAEFTEYAKLAKERFNRFQVESFASFAKVEGDTSEKLYMQMNYLFKIREETEGVTYLKKTIQLLNDEGIPITLYIPPVNYMQGERFFGPDFKKRYMDNFTKLYSFLDKCDLKYSVTDASFLLTDDEFAAAHTTDETANYSGRSKLLNFFSESEPLRSLFE
ncbi:hypothetical protein Elgi_54920 [Paenibacillus elgii]|uniref:hypothetical protein n=1 Tax=Paenibacillus elgii TaxID=189691 RepID=UPI002D7B7D13|nr:hypothetical protein Elgi_54920 [Paenibacillus elgii]